MNASIPAMAVPSAVGLRGQRDATGFASSREQMEAVWAASLDAPAPRELGPEPTGPVLGAVCPHDDYLLAARVYRRVIPLVTARTVVIVGTFHRYKAFDFRGRVVLDGRKAWRSPHGPIAVSPLSSGLAEALGDGAATSAELHDAEHSIEAVAYWLKARRADLEIIPVLAPAGPFERVAELAEATGRALARLASEAGLEPGRDLAVVVSSDAVHYGEDFSHAPFGVGAAAHARAVERDVGILTGPLSGPIGLGGARAFLETVTNPANSDEYLIPWCGRFAIPYGSLTLAALSDALGLGGIRGYPLAYATTAESPELPLRSTGLGTTGPADHSHFVGLPALAYAR